MHNIISLPTSDSNSVTQFDLSKAENLHPLWRVLEWWVNGEPIERRTGTDTWEQVNYVELFKPDVEYRLMPDVTKAKEVCLHPELILAIMLGKTVYRRHKLLKRWEKVTDTYTLNSSMCEYKVEEPNSYPKLRAYLADYLEEDYVSKLIDECIEADCILEDAYSLRAIRWTGSPRGYKFWDTLHNHIVNEAFMCAWNKHLR